MQVELSDEPGVSPYGTVGPSPIPTPARPDPSVPRPIGVVYPSRTGGDTPHIVTRLDIGVIVCTCQAMRSIEGRPEGCWAMKDARRIISGDT